MSVELVAEVRALRNVSAEEKLVLYALADDARRDSRTASPGWDDDARGNPGLLTSTCMGKTKLSRVLGALMDPERAGGPLIRVSKRGQKHQRAEYEFLLPEAAPAHSGFAQCGR